MSFDYVAKVNTFVDLLRAHNTTTASPDISSSLTTRISTITVSDPMMSGQRHGSYPWVSVEIASGNEEETQIGNYSTRRKIKTVNYSVWGFYKKEGAAKQDSSQLIDAYQLANNIEAVIKKESDFSGTALHVELLNTSFGERLENIYIKVIKIDAAVKYFYN